MKKRDKNNECCPTDELKDACSREEKDICEIELSFEEKIYNVLNTAEKIAVKAAKINQILKKTAKKKKKNKKLGKIDKKTGALILKKERKQKVQKPMKRYKAKKKR